MRTLPCPGTPASYCICRLSKRGSGVGCVRTLLFAASQVRLRPIVRAREGGYVFGNLASQFPPGACLRVERSTGEQGQAFSGTGGGSPGPSRLTGCVKATDNAARQGRLTAQQEDSAADGQTTPFAGMPLNTFQQLSFLKSYAFHAPLEHTLICTRQQQQELKENVLLPHMGSS